MDKVTILDGVPVQRAIKAYQEGDTAPLIELFRNGFPLHKFPEAVDIITNGINGKSSRKRGRPPIQKEMAVQVAAQLIGAGMGAISNGETSKLTATDIVGKIKGISASAIQKDLRKRLPSAFDEDSDEEDDPVLLFQYNLGREMESEVAESFINSYLQLL